MYDAGFCDLFKTEVPSTNEDWVHRICKDFRPNEAYEEVIGSKTDPTLDERFNWFGSKMEEGILYGFPYNVPKNLKKLKDMTGAS